MNDFHGLGIKTKLLLALILTITACSHEPTNNYAEPKATEGYVKNADSLYVVDCMLPGRLRKLGQSFTYLTPRRPIKTTAINCEIRGGEYVAYDRSSYATALKIWLPKAEEGDPQAQTYVGEIYEKGLGVQPDYQTAAKWYQKAADQGYSRAQINLGYLHENGMIGEKDLVTALNWYRKASGLEGEDLAFASTIEAAVRQEYEQEIALLKNELSRGKTEIDAQRKALADSRYRLNLGREKLDRARKELEETRRQLDTIKKSPGNTQNLNLIKYEQELKAKEAELARTSQEVQNLEGTLKQQNTSLTTQLKKSQERAELLNQKIAQHQQQNTLVREEYEQKIAALKNELAQSKNEVSAQQKALAESQNNLTAGKNKLDRVRQELETTRARLESMKSSKTHSEKDINQYERQLNVKQAELARTYQEVQSLEAALKKQDQSFNVELRKSQARTKELNQKIARYEKENVLLQEKLNATASNLTQTETKLSRLNKEYQKEKEKISSEKSQLKKLTANELDKVGADLVQLEKALAEREKQQQLQRQRIRELETERKAFQKTLTELNAGQQTRVAGKPSIEIIEPPFVLTRGMPTIRLRSIMKQREIIGKVTAPAGLLALNVNDLKTIVNDAGIFRSMIKLKKDKTPVKTVAIDKIGNTAVLEFLLLSAKNGNPIEPSKGSAPVSNIDFGKNHALIIGNQSYQNLPTLKTPRNDANAIDKILREKYGFKTSLILDADRYSILSKLNQLRETLTEQDNLLVYYAGHGEYDQVNLRGHWLPVDAEPNNSANWISTVAITDILNAMSATHIMVIADSCYSGAMTRTSLARLEPGMSSQLKQKWLKVMAKTRSRTVLTSGSLEPVLDTGLNGHSIFANALIYALGKNNGILEGQNLYRIVAERVRKATSKLDFKQEPQYAPIKFGGHESGDFFLVRQQA